jgi:hypothetical protein
VVEYQGIRLPRLNHYTAVAYHQACIAYLRKLALDYEQVRDEDFLAAAVILRYYEELDRSLESTTSGTAIWPFKQYVNAQANPFAFGMSESKRSDFLRPGSAVGTFDQSTVIAYLKSFQHASFRVALRQEIAMALTDQRGIQLPLETWAVLQGFDQAEDFVWADRHLYHCAKVVQFCLGKDVDTKQGRCDRWKELKSFEELWDKHKPLSFMPIRKPMPDSKSHREPLPDFWYMADVQVAGLSSLDLARILLILYDPYQLCIGFEAAEDRQHREAEVRWIVLRMCATAMSLRGTAQPKPSSQPVMIQAYAAIMACGGYFSDATEQRALMLVLERLKLDHGWRTEDSMLRLRKTWKWPPI